MTGRRDAHHVARGRGVAVLAAFFVLLAFTPQGALASLPRAGAPARAALTTTPDALAEQPPAARFTLA